jgi:2-hydroxychromene-2-carboxylate isomerase
MIAGRDQSSAAFYFDLASPLAYLIAERILPTLPVLAEWQPILARELPGAERFEGFRREADEQAFRENVERSARTHGLQPLKWPAPFPFDSEPAMLAATYAKGIGRTVPFVQAAFRQAFAGGHNLQQTDFVLIAAAACEMHPTAVLQGMELRSVREQLTANTAAARAVGVTDVPAIRIEERVFQGEQALEQAAAHLSSHGTHASGSGNAARKTGPATLETGPLGPATR